MSSPYKMQIIDLFQKVPVDLTAQNSTPEPIAIPVVEALTPEQIFSPGVLFLEADIVVKGILIILAVVSMISWAIIFDRWQTYRKGDKQWKTFSRRFWSGTDLRELSKDIGPDRNSPHSLMFVAVMREYSSSAGKSSNINQKLELIVQSHWVQFQHQMEFRLGWLASISSSAPFIGLLGTVWGIMNSFQSIAETQQSHLAVVAPGIAEALFATAAGLFAAIPAGFAYNLFVSRKERLIADMGRFADDLLVTVLRHQDQR